MSGSDNKFMRLAISEAEKNISGGDGGPFGAVIVKDGEVIAAEHNNVLKTKDPTMHAEISAIRKACVILGRHDLSDCELYTTCEPCIMCLGAIYWARIPKIYYGSDKNDAEKIGFDDKRFHESVSNGERVIEAEQTDYEICADLFRRWDKKAEKTMY